MLAGAQKGISLNQPTQIFARLERTHKKRKRSLHSMGLQYLMALFGGNGGHLVAACFMDDADFGGWHGVKALHIIRRGLADGNNLTSCSDAPACAPIQVKPLGKFMGLWEIAVANIVNGDYRTRQAPPQYKRNHMRRNKENVRWALHNFLRQRAMRPHAARGQCANFNVGWDGIFIYFASRSTPKKALNQRNGFGCGPICIEPPLVLSRIG